MLLVLLYRRVKYQRCVKQQSVTVRLLHKFSSATEFPEYVPCSVH